MDAIIPTSKIRGDNVFVALSTMVGALLLAISISGRIEGPGKIVVQLRIVWFQI